MPPILKPLALCLALALPAAAAAQADQRLTLPQARALAMQALAQGDAPLAAGLARGLLQADPDDRRALVILAAAEPALGRPAEGRRAGARAFHVSKGALERYEAARLAARAAMLDGRPTLSQYWLRRSVQAAPNEPMRRQSIRDFRRMRAVNPWRFDLQVSVSPESNLNGGSDSRFNVIDGVNAVGVLSPSARALSGTAAHLSFDVTRRLSQSATTRTELGGYVFAREVRLSDAARAMAPTVENGDLASAGAELRLTRLQGDAQGRTSATLSAGQYWYGRDPYNRTLGLSVARSQALAPDLQLGLGAIARASREIGDGDRSGSLTLSGTLERGFGWGTVSASLAWGRTYADRANGRSHSLRGGIGLAPSRALGPVAWSVNLGLEAQHFPDYAIATLSVPGGREDLQASASLRMMLPDYDYAGFAPVVTLRTATTDSNVSRFDRRATSLSVGFASTF